MAEGYPEKKATMTKSSPKDKGAYSEKATGKMRRSPGKLDSQGAVGGKDAAQYKACKDQ